MTRGKKGWLLGLAMVLMIVTQSVKGWALSSPRPYHVLILHAYHQGYEWTDSVQQGLWDVLSLQPQVVLHVEYMDTLRNIGDDYDDALETLLKTKYREVPLALIVASDDPAVMFVQDRLISEWDVPVVFCGVNHYEPKQYEDIPKLTGINGTISARETVEVAFQLRPQARRLVVVSGSAPSEQRNLTVFQKQVQGLRLSVEPEYLDMMEPDALRTALEQLSVEDIVVYLGYLVTPSGVQFTVEESVKLVQGSSPAPVFGLWDFLLPHGILGGKVVHGRSQGVAAAELVVEAMNNNGNPLPPVQMESPNRFLFNGEEIDSFGIDVSELPLHAMLMNRPVDEFMESWWDESRSSFFSYELFQKHGTYMWLVDPQTGIILDANQSMIEEYGYPGLIGMHVGEINPLGKEAMSRVAGEVKRGLNNRFTFQHLLADGRMIDVNVDSYPITILNRTVLFSIITDVTEQMEAERALLTRRRILMVAVLAALLFQAVLIGYLGINIRSRKRTERRLSEQMALFEGMADNAFDIMTILSGEGLVTYQNRALMRVLGMEPEEVLGKSAFFLLHPEDAPRIMAMLGEILKEKGMHLMAEYRMRGREGSWVWLESSALNLLYDDRIKGILVSSRDITERKREQELLIHAKELAEATTRAQKQFLSNMSHEIRTPMNGFMGMLQLLEQTDLSEEQRELLEFSSKSSKALLSVVNGILDISLLESGKMHLLVEPFSPAALAEDVQDMFLLAARSKKISLHLSLEEGVPPRCMGDRFRIQQVLANLVGNAVKFTQRGHVTISLRTLPATNPDRVILVFCVEDTGIGIPKEQQGRIFEHFSQADETMTRRFGGSGLGLAICRGIVGLMDGSITVESSEGKGSLFCFSFEVETNYRFC